MPQFPMQGQSRFGAEGDGAAKQDVASPAAGAISPGVTEAVLSFEPETVGRAIVFHLLDEGLAREVTAESVKRTVSRLRRRGLRPAIRRGTWEAMTNHERLEWLLSETMTVPLMRPEVEVVSLETRDGR
jgi:hypothetical protein